MRKMQIITVATLSMTLGCFTHAADSASQSQIRNHEAPGNLQSLHALGCIRTDRVDNRYTPVDLYMALSHCAKAGEYETAAFLFAIAGVYGRFDSLRVADRSAHQAVTVVRAQALLSLDETGKTRFAAYVKNTFGNPDRLAMTCERIIRLGPPDYYPRYMIQHGMGAFLKNGSENGLVSDFDENIAWKQSLDTYLHCPGL